MQVQELISKSEVLLEALPYIQRFRGSTFVIKYGGSFMDDPDPTVRSRVATDIAFFAAVGINVIVVHGGGKAITRAMADAGLKATFIKGQRVTDEATVVIVKKTLDETVNGDVCRLIADAGAKPMGMPGDSVLVCEKLTVDDDGDSVLVCEKLTVDDDGEPIDLGYVGEVTEVKVKLIKKAISEGFVPVISPVAEGLDGKPYNVNADLVAGKVASALLARRLVYMSDVPGVLADFTKPESLISSIKVGEVESLKQRGVIDKGMRPKIQSAMRALQAGVKRVHFIDGRMPHSLLLEIFTDKGIGTEIVHG